MYIMQVSLLCRQTPETVAHFLIDCTGLEEKRQPIMDSLLHATDDIVNPVPNTKHDLVQLLPDPSVVIDSSEYEHLQGGRKFEKRLCYTLHTDRCKQLNLVPQRNRKTVTG